MTTWYTCIRCPPHSLADHTIYDDRKCLIADCPCQAYQPDETKPLPPRIKKPPFRGPFNNP